MHLLLRVVFAVLLMVGCGLVSARFLSYQTGAVFSFSIRLYRNKFFWYGVLVALMFLYSDYRFDRAFSLKTN